MGIAVATFIVDSLVLHAELEVIEHVVGIVEAHSVDALEATVTFVSSAIELADHFAEVRIEMVVINGGNYSLDLFRSVRLVIDHLIAEHGVGG